MFVHVQAEEHIQQQILWYGYYEKKYVLTWEGFIRKDWIVVDIGANIGYYALVAAGKTENGTVYALEPASANFMQLEENIRVNHLSNVIAVQQAVSANAEKRTLYVSSNENTGMTGLFPAGNFTQNTEFINTVSLDDWAAATGLQKIDCIKMDIEGSEYDALLGMAGILRKWKPVLFIELSNELLKRFGKNHHQVYELLISFGYKAYHVIAEKKLQQIPNHLEDELVVFLPDGYDVSEKISVI